MFFSIHTSRDKIDKMVGVVGLKMGGTSDLEADLFMEKKDQGLWPFDICETIHNFEFLEL